MTFIEVFNKIKESNNKKYMIRKIRFNNFYSFKEEQEISFLAKKKKSYDYFQSKSSDQITKVAGFVGGNASGKTNIMRLFSFLSYFVCRGSKGETNLNPLIATKTFFNNKKQSSFYIEFEDNDTIFFYEFSVKENVVLNESLSIKKLQKGSRKIVVFSRELNNISKLNNVFFKDLPKKFLIRSDVSFISFLKLLYNIEMINNVFNYFAKIKTNINEKGQVNFVMHQIGILNLYLENSKLKKEMENVVHLFDLGLKSFDIEKKIQGESSRIFVRGIHATQEENNKLDFSYESKGTQSLFFTLASILSALKDNSVVVIDEFEEGFHPEAFNKFISYFIDENKDGNAQLLFSSHSLGFMNKLDMQQIYLTEKNEKSESVVYRLSQVKGIRSDENFLAKYMAGAYGAFPKIKA